jgi:hypothetical protein
VFFRGSHLSHYYGASEDGSSSTNDANIFIGSSNIGDGGGRQLNMKTGDLGDRPNVFKVYGSYVFNWHARPARSDRAVRHALGKRGSHGFRASSASVRHDSLFRTGGCAAPTGTFSWT